MNENEALGFSQEVFDKLHDDIKRLARMVARLEAIGISVGVAVEELRTQLLRCGDEKRLADAAHLANRAANAAEDTRKRLTNLSELCGLTACQLQIEVVQSGEKIKGDLCYAEVTADRSPKQPQKRVDPKDKQSELTPEYKNYLRSLGASEEAIEKNLLAPYWPGCKDEHTRRLANNEPTFDGISIGEDAVVFKLKTKGRPIKHK